MYVGDSSLLQKNVMNKNFFEDSSLPVCHHGERVGSQCSLFYTILSIMFSAEMNQVNVAIVSF